LQNKKTCVIILVKPRDRGGWVYTPRLEWSPRDAGGVETRIKYIK